MFNFITFKQLCNSIFNGNVYNGIRFYMIQREKEVHLIGISEDGSKNLSDMEAVLGELIPEGLYIDFWLNLSFFSPKEASYGYTDEVNEADIFEELFGHHYSLNMKMDREYYSNGRSLSKVVFKNKTEDEVLEDINYGALAITSFYGDEDGQRHKLDPKTVELLSYMHFDSSATPSYIVMVGEAIERISFKNEVKILSTLVTIPQLIEYNQKQLKNNALLENEDVDGLIENIQKTFPIEFDSIALHDGFKSFDTFLEVEWDFEKVKDQKITRIGFLDYRDGSSYSDTEQFYCELENGMRVMIGYNQDCCASTYIETCDFDRNHIGNYIGETLTAIHEKKVDTSEQVGESSTANFYVFETSGGSIDLMWRGTSNGYYSEECSLLLYRPITQEEVLEAPEKQ